MRTTMLSLIGIVTCIFLLVGCTPQTPPPQVVSTTITNPYYAEGYYHNPGTPDTITITDDNVLYNVTGWSTGDYNGFTFVDEGITTASSGMYQFSGTVSFTGGNGGEYGFGLLINGVQQGDCGMSRTATSTAIGNVGFTCLKYLTVGDHLNFAVKDANAPAQDIEIYKMNINIVQIT